MRLIDADALADALFDKRKNYPQWVADTIGNMPEAVVRCKDCKHWETESAVFALFGKCERWHLCGVYGSDWFCADGERKEGR